MAASTDDHEQREGGVDFDGLERFNWVAEHADDPGAGMEDRSRSFTPTKVVSRMRDLSAGLRNRETGEMSRREAFRPPAQLRDREDVAQKTMQNGRGRDEVKIAGSSRRRTIVSVILTRSKAQGRAGDAQRSESGGGFMTRVPAKRSRLWSPSA